MLSVKAKCVHIGKKQKQKQKPLKGPEGKGPELCIVLAWATLTDH